MNITLFGIIWTILLIYCFLVKNNNYMIILTLLSTVLQCDSVIVLSGNRGVGPMIVTSIVFIIWYIVKSFPKYKIQLDKTTLYSLILISSVIISLQYNGESIFGDKILYILQLVIYIICFLCMRKMTLKFKIDVNKLFLPIICLVLIMGIVQYLIFLRIIPQLGIITQLFYSDIWDGTNAYNGLGTLRLRLFSTFKEPSYCACFLVGTFFYVCFNYEKIKNSKILIMVILIEILLTLSSTAYVALFVVGLIFAILSQNKKMLKILIPLGIIVLFITYFTGVLDIVIFKKSSTGSAAERNMWNTNALKNFYSSPIIGIGFKNARASSIVYNLLSDMGLIGIISYILFNLNYLMYIFDKKSGMKINNGSLYFLLAVVICQIISCPDLELCVFWLAMYLIGLSDIRYKGGNNETTGIYNNNKL